MFSGVKDSKIIHAINQFHVLRISVGVPRDKSYVLRVCILGILTL